MLPVPLLDQLAIDVGPGQSGPVGLLVVLVLGAVCVFLFRSMTKQLRRVPRSFDPPPAPTSAPPPVTPPDGREDA